MKNTRWKKLFYVLTITYFVFVLILAAALYLMSYMYNQLNIQHAEQMKSEITEILHTGDRSDLPQTLSDFEAANNIDLVVITPDELVYSSMPTADFAILNKTVNQEQISFYGAFTVEQDGIIYQVWTAVYKINSEQFFIIMMTAFVLAVLVLACIIIVLLLLVFRNSIKPLSRLRDNILKLRRYQLDEVAAKANANEYDRLSQELSEFTDDLQEKMDVIGTQYSQLERELQEKQEQHISKINLVRSLIHDAKTPVSLELLNISQLKKHDDDAEAYEKRLKNMEQNNRALLADILDIMKILNDDDLQTLAQKEVVDIVGEVKNLMLRFETAIKNKNLFFIADMPAFLEIKINRIQLKQLLYNIISNICQYTDAGGEFEMTIYEADGFLHIIAANDVSDTSGIDFARVFDLFYIAGNNELSSGVGMYVIKQAAESLGGSAQFAPTEQGVRLSVQFPLLKAGDSDEA